MRSRSAHRQRELFEEDKAPIELSPDLKRRVLPLLQAMMIEILTPTARVEVDSDEDQL
jgi:hypothetical protein